jgi:hypothetical protein
LKGRGFSRAVEAPILIELYSLRNLGCIEAGKISLSG